MTDNNQKKLKFPYSLDTKEKKEKYTRNRKRILALGTILLILGFILSIFQSLESFAWIIFLVGFYIIMFFYYIFWIENLVVMFRVGRIGYGFASIFIPIVFVFFFFIHFLPFLEGDKTIEELEGKK
jgi:hypothetical protein